MTKVPAAYVLPSASNARVGAVDVDAAQLKLIDQVRRFARVVLPLDRHEDRGRRRPCLPVLDRLPVDLVDLPQDRLAPIRRRLEQPHRRDQLVVDDVAERPAAAQPGTRILGARS